MHCRSCGRMNRLDAMFCDGCGACLTAPLSPTLKLSVTADAHHTEGEGKLRPDHSHPPKPPEKEVFVGRQHEMEVLKAALEEALSGRGRVVMLVGDPGIGKTRTAQELSIYATQRGARVLWGRCYESPGAPPYWPWVQIIRTYTENQGTERTRAHMDRGAADIAGLGADLREYLPDLPSPPMIVDSEQARFRLFDSITTFLIHLAKSQPLVLVLDNLHWADTPSLMLLEFMARDIARSRLLVVGTYRDVELSRQHPLSDTLAELSRDHPFHRTMLTGLSRDDVGQFIDKTIGGTPPLTLVEALYNRTEGNPLFLTELVRLLLQEGDLTAERWHYLQNQGIKIPAGVREAIGQRLNRLSSRCVQTLTCASVIGREFGFEELTGFIDDQSEEAVFETIDEALAARVLDELPRAGHYQFTHVLIRETLYDELPAARRSRLHRRFAEVLERLYGADLEPQLARLAYHFIEAAQAGSIDRAIAYAARAGARAETLLAYEEAARHYDMALHAIDRRHAGDEAQRCRLLLCLGEAQRKAGDFSQAMQTFQRAAVVAQLLGSSEDLARAALGFEDTAWRPGLPGDAAVQLCEKALTALGEGDNAVKARVLGALTRALAFTGTFDRAATISKRAIDMARRLGDASTLTATMRVCLYARYVRWGTDHIEDRLAAATEMVRLAEQAGDKSMVLEAYLWRLFDLMELGHVPAVETQLKAHTRLAQELRQPFYLYNDISFRAMVAIFRGHFEEGERLAQQALAIGQRLRGQDPLGVFGVEMFTIRREQGRLQEMAPAIRHFVERSPEAARWRPGLALIYSELGLEAEARAEFEHLAAHDFVDLPQDALWILCIVYLTDVCVFLGDTRRAAILYQLIQHYDGHTIVAGPTVACYGAAARYLGMLAATMGRWTEAQRHFEDALAMNARIGALPWLAHTRYRYAAMLMARGRPSDRPQAVSLVEAALATSRELGMHTLEQRATMFLDDIRSPRARTLTYADGLTSREVEVLRLIAVGKSNRDIADALFISLNTVANHVRNILSKVGATNRTEAAAYAIRHGLIAFSASESSPPSSL